MSDGQSDILEWLTRDFERNWTGSELCRYELGKHEDAFRVRAKRLYREYREAMHDGRSGSAELRDLLRYLVDQLRNGDFLAGKKRGGTWRVEPMACKKQIVPLLMLGGVAEPGIAQGMLGDNDRIRATLLRASEALAAGKTGAITGGTLADLVRAMLDADRVPARRSSCETLLEHHEDYLLDTAELGGKDRAAVEAWLRTDEFYEQFKRVTASMVIPPRAGDDEDMTEEDIADYLAIFYYQGYRAAGAPIDRERHAENLRLRFQGDFDNLCRMVTLPEVDQELKNLGVVRGEQGFVIGGGHARKANLPRGLVDRYNMLAQSGRIHDEKLVDEAYEAYMVIKDAPGLKHVRIPLEVSARPAGTQVEVPVGLYLMPGREQEGKDRPHVTLMAGGGSQELTLDEVLRAQGASRGKSARRTEREIKDGVSVLVSQRKAMANTYLMRIRKMNGSAPDDIPERLHGFFAL